MRNIFKRDSNKWKKLNIHYVPVALIVGSLLLYTPLMEKGYASSAQPGSASDPLVSQSYVDGKFNQLQTQISSIISGSQQGSGVITNPNQTTSISTEVKDAIIEEVMAQLEFLYGQKLTEPGAETERFQPVFANNGDILMCGEGTEIILRSGGAVAYITALNGLSNISNGTEIMNNEYIPFNNLLIVPRDDGRGVMAVEDSWFLIKGDYSILR